MNLLSIVLATTLLTADLERKAEHMEDLLMAPCCWASTIAQHDSDVATTMKHDVRKMLQDGMSESQILAVYESKYGERVLSKPKATGFGRLLWLLPVFLFSIGGWMLLQFLRKKTVVQNTVPAPLPSSLENVKYLRQIDDELHNS